MAPNFKKGASSCHRELREPLLSLDAVADSHAFISCGTRRSAVISDHVSARRCNPLPRRLRFWAMAACYFDVIGTTGFPFQVGTRIATRFG
jgi:hypothetical protein